MGKRDNQEDSLYPRQPMSRPGQKFFVVCDGVGGSEDGELASSIVAAHIGKKLSKMNLNEVFNDEKMLEVLDDAYIALDNAATDDNRDMGTTLTMLCFHAGGCVMAHIGDSRIYQIRPHQGIIYRSDDHSLVNQLLRAGHITAEEAINHPQSNVITRCMSPTFPDQRRSMATVYYTSDVREDDVFVLCSDGVLHCITDDELVQLLLDPAMSDSEKVAELARICVHSSDNNTAWVVRVDDVELSPSEMPTTEHSDGQPAHDGTSTITTMVSSIKDLESVTRGSKSTFMTRFKKLFS